MNKQNVNIQNKNIEGNNIQESLDQIKKDITKQFLQNQQIFQYFIDGLVDKVYTQISNKINLQPASNSKQISELENRIRELLASVKKYRAEIQTLKRENESLQQFNSNLQRENNILQNESKNYQQYANENAYLKNKYSKGYLIDFKLFTDICNTLYHNNRLLYDKIINYIEPQEKERDEKKDTNTSKNISFESKFGKDILTNEELDKIFRNFFQ